MEEGLPNRSSEFADEGTLAHEFGDLSLRRYLGKTSAAVYLNKVAELRKNKLYFKGMENEVEKYTAFVVDALADARAVTPDATLFVEQRLDFSEYVPDGFGTGDAVIVGDGVLHVVDLKFGRGVLVEAEGNPQLMLYALGALHDFGLLYDVKSVRVTVAQVRLNSIQSHEISVPDLLNWAETVVRPKAAAADKGEGVHVAGEHCRWCKAKATCRAFADLATGLARHDFAPPETLTDAELCDMFAKLPLLADYAKAVGEHMRDRAAAGHKWPGLKLVAGQGRRTWGDAEAAKKALKALGLKPADYLKPQELRGLGEVADLVSKDTWEEKLSGFIVKSIGAPCLVPDADKRPPISAADDFR